MFRANDYPESVVKSNLRAGQHHPTPPQRDISQVPIPSSQESGTRLRVLLTTGSEDCKQVKRHPQKFPSAGQADQTRQEEERCHLWSHAKTLTVFSVYFGDVQNFGEAIGWTQVCCEEAGHQEWIAVHARTNQHQVDWNAAKARQFDRNYWKRVLEILHIHQQQPKSNLACGLSINPSCLSLLDTLLAPWCTPN